MYPQTVVPSGDDLHTTLTNGMDAPDSGVTFTGKHYTANKDNIGWNPSYLGTTQELNPVYEYKGERYVKVTPYRYEATESSKYRYNYSTAENPDYIDREGYRWFKVEPIKWIILNHNWLPKDAIKDYEGSYAYGEDVSKAHSTLELYAADALFCGVPFGNQYHTAWNQSIIYRYLNDIFYEEAFPMTYIPDSTIYNNPSDGSYSSSNSEYNLNSNYISSGGKNPTNQKIYMLSYYALFNNASPYIKNDTFGINKISDSLKRQVDGTDYARAHYLELEISNDKPYATYWLRTANSGSRVYSVNNTGGSNSGNASVTYYGTRPALTIVCFAL